MAKWGKFEFGDFKKMADSFQETLNERVIDQFIRDFLLEMAYRAERKIKKRTPVGKSTYRIKTDENGEKIRFKKGKRKGEFKKEIAHTGGHLRRNWHVGKVEKRGNAYVVEIFNNTEYASYVEFGHRQEVGRYVPAIGKRLKEPWVEGRFMMTISMKEIERELPRYLEKRQMQLLEQIMNGRPTKGGGK